MLQYQPSPMLVIRNQLLAFLILNLLGSCIPIQSIPTSIADVSRCYKHCMPASKLQPSQIKLLSPY